MKPLFSPRDLVWRESYMLSSHLAPDCCNSHHLGSPTPPYFASSLLKMLQQDSLLVQRRRILSSCYSFLRPYTAWHCNAFLTSFSPIPILGSLRSSNLNYSRLSLAQTQTLTVIVPFLLPLPSCGTARHFLFLHLAPSLPLNLFLLFSQRLGLFDVLTRSCRAYEAVLLLFCLLSLG